MQPRCIWRRLVLKFVVMTTVVTPSVEIPVEAESVALLIRRTGARATPARIRVLQLLQAAPAALTSHEIEQSIGDLVLDRVTLYRVLDWLSDAGLANKAADARGVFRFSAANPDGEHLAHIHLRCTGCGGVFCLDVTPPPPPVLPQGFRFGGMALDVRGECPSCGLAHP